MGLKGRVFAWVVAGAVLGGTPLLAQGAKAAKKPANATAECSDGTFSTAKTQAGACSKHGGVKTWFGAPDTKADAKSNAAAGDAKSKDTAKKESSKESTKAGATAKNAGTPPAGATGQCADGSYTRAKTQQGGCSNHGGVKTWFADAGAAPSNVPAVPKNTPPAKTLPAPQPTPAAPQPAPTATPAAPAAPVTKQPAPTKPAGGAATPKSSGKAQIVAPPPGTPDNATAKCKDGTFSFAKTHTGACSNHGGVAEWYR